MLIAANGDGTAHAVSLNPPTRENPRGYHRLIGGSIEFGETHREAIVREVVEELSATILDLQHVGVVENVFEIDGEAGHEIVFLYSGRLNPEPAIAGATLTESDGSVVPVVWRPFDDSGEVVPLYPAGVNGILRQLEASIGSPERSVPDRPEIVCICGSTRFVEEMRAANRDLTFAGVIVVAPGEADEALAAGQKTVLDALHLRKIDLADRVLVVNPGGYIGESTSREIDYARAAGKPVSFTDPF